MQLKDYQEDRGERGVFDKRNALNNLTGREWLFSTKTIITPLESNNNYNKSTSNNELDILIRFLNIFSKENEDAILYIPNLLKKYRSQVNQYLSQKGCNRNVMTVDDSYFLEDDKKKSFTTNFIYYDLFKQPKIQSNSKFDQFIKKVITQCKFLFDHLQINHYFVISIPNHIDFGNGKKIFNFTMTAQIYESLRKHNFILKSERIWFDKQFGSSKILFYPLRKRFLVFRKEEEFNVNSVPQNTILTEFNGKGTRILHKGYPPSFNHKLRSEHGGMKPPEINELLISTFSKKESDLILDPFAGVGGTLLGAALQKRMAIGIDINGRWKEIYQQVCDEFDLGKQTYYIGDSRSIIGSKVENHQIDLILTDVPYWAMDKLKKTRGKFSRAGEPPKNKLKSSLKSFNESKISTVDEWLLLMKEVFEQTYSKLQKDGFLIVFIGNMYRTMNEGDKRIGRFHMLSIDLARVLKELGYKLYEEIIWYSPDKSLHIFGYPYSYIPSVVHQTILIFKK